MAGRLSEGYNRVTAAKGGILPDDWTVEETSGGAFLVTPNGLRVALMTKARAHGIAAALNTPQGYEAFEVVSRQHGRKIKGKA